MKRYLILILFLFLVPIQTKAYPEIKKVSITGSNEVTVGETLTLNFEFNFSGIQKHNTDSAGIAAIIFELLYDPSTFTIIDATAPGFETSVTMYEKKYYVMSEVSEQSIGDKCIDEVTHCGPYKVTLQFAVNDTEEPLSMFQIGEIAVSYVRQVELGKVYEENDIDVFTQTSISNKTINVKKNQNMQPPEKEPESIITNQKPTIDHKVPNQKEENSTPPKTEIPSKSSNNYLKTLEIQNHKIHFLKTKNEYNITVGEEEKQLQIHAETDDSKATYQIIGADDLEKNNYKVSIDVTAENGEKNNYILNVSVRESSGIVYERPKQNQKLFQFKWKKQYTIMSGLLLIFIVIIIVIIKIKDKKIDKGLDEL